MAGLAVHLARLVGAALVAVVAQHALAADRLSARVEMYGPLGLHVLTLRTALEQTEQTYSAVVDYTTAGLAGVVFEQKTHAAAQGHLARATAYPDAFSNETVHNGLMRHSRVEYAADGIVNGTASPPPANPVPPAMTRGTVDNVSAYLRLERQLAATGKCGLTVPVFDGRYRYDLVFTDGGRQQLTPEAGQRFTGTATVCHMTRRTRVAQAGEESEGASRGTFWYAALAPGGGIMVPVRMRLQTQLGTVEGYLAELHGPGVDIRWID